MRHVCQTRGGNRTTRTRLANVFRVMGVVWVGQWDEKTYMTMRTVLTTTLWTPPPRMGSAITGKVSLTIMFARSSVTSRRCPFLRMGLILFA